MGQIVTFYSYKGGTGRTMTLANIAVLLAQWGHKVLIVDWDLEAPGLENFFKEYLDLEKVSQQKGLIDLLGEISDSSSQSQEPLSWQDLIIRIRVPDSRDPLHLLTAGKKDREYFNRVRHLDIQTLYSKKGGGRYIEALRNEWKQAYDYVLIDSRTGVTDIGGVCTVQLPDMLVLLFTATEQSFNGVIEVNEKARRARQRLPVDRLSLVSIPIASKFDTSEDFETKQKWLDRFSSKFSEIYANWLPDSVESRPFLEVTKIPYISYFSFGEKLAVLEQGTTDPTGLGYAYENLAALIGNNLESVEQLLVDRDKFVRSASRKRAIFIRSATNPFLVKARVPPERFIGRKQEVALILDRLANPSNQGGSAINGPRGIGKTSLLNYLGSPYASQIARGLSPEGVHFINIPIDTMVPFNVFEFWDYLFSNLAQWPANQFKQQVNDLLQILQKGSPPHIYHLIDSLFKLMGQEQLVVVLLDNFDRILKQIQTEAISAKRNKEQTEYLAFLGTIAALINLPAPRGFSLIVTSEKPVYDLLSGQESVAFGSAFYNNMASIPLRSFSEAKCNELLDTYLEGTGINFGTHERDKLYRNSGGHPGDFQEAAFKLFKRKVVQLEEERSKTADSNVTAWAWGVLTQATTLLFTQTREILKDWREKRRLGMPSVSAPETSEPTGEAPITDVDMMIEVLQRRNDLAAQETDIKNLDSLMAQIRNRRKIINDYRTELARMQTVETKLWLEERIEEEQEEVAEAAEEMRQVLERLSGRPVKVEALEVT